MVDHKVPWELIGIGHIEPVESTIYEIADSRNQAMDDITMYLDPIVKVKKDPALKRRYYFWTWGSLDVGEYQ
jgi:hypothetical protein